MPETRLQNPPQLAPFAAQMLALGYRSAEQFLGTAAVAPDALAKYLRVDVNALRAIAASIAGPPLLAAAHAPRRKHPLGVRLDRIRRSSSSLMRAPGAAVALPPKVNLIAEMQPIRDQGERGTCVAPSSAASRSGSAEASEHGSIRLLETRVQPSALTAPLACTAASWLAGIGSGGRIAACRRS